MHQGLNMDFNPFIGSVSNPSVQEQQWPGTEEQMIPKPDHGEESYLGGGKLEGKTALITGGDSGIGRAVAIAFAREGADIAFSYLYEDEDAKETVYWVEKAGKQALAIKGDLQDPKYCHDLVERTIKKYGSLNILVNNAAFQIGTRDFQNISPEQLDQTFRTNIMSFFWTTQSAIRHMQAGDSIINVGSVVAMMGYAELVDYSCTKAAVHNFTKSMSQLLAEKGIRVNCVAPGPVWTPLIPATMDKNFVKSFGTESFWKRPAQPAEIAPSFVFLASADARFYTGEVLAPTGYSTTSR